MVSKPSLTSLRWRSGLRFPSLLNFPPPFFESHEVFRTKARLHSCFHGNASIRGDKVPITVWALSQGVWKCTANSWKDFNLHLIPSYSLTADFKTKQLHLKCKSVDVNQLFCHSTFIKYLITHHPFMNTVTLECMMNINWAYLQSPTAPNYFCPSLEDTSVFLLQKDKCDLTQQLSALVTSQLYYIFFYKFSPQSELLVTGRECLIFSNDGDNTGQRCAFFCATIGLLAGNRVSICSLLIPATYYRTSSRSKTWSDVTRVRPRTLLVGCIWPQYIKFDGGPKPCKMHTLLI